MRRYDSYLSAFYHNCGAKHLNEKRRYYYMDFAHHCSDMHLNV